MLEGSDILSVTALCISIITLFISAVGVYITYKSAVKSIEASEKSFRRTTTLQTEIFILSAYKDHMDMIYTDTTEEHKNNAKIRFISAIDLYCKYVVNGHLDKKLSDDNLHFYEECIKTFKDTIKKDKEVYNNIIDYAKKYNISLD